MTDSLSDTALTRPMTDPFGRRISYLRVSVTDRCDLRCFYCMSEDMTFLPKADLLTLEELDRLCSAFIHKGVKKLRLTGGEPLLQVDAELIAALHAEGFAVGIETNGTLLPPDGIDWICVSPKAGAELKLRHGHELKLVYPQDGAAPERFEGLAFERFSLQPMDGPDAAANTARAIDYCQHHPQWRLSLQTHKMIGIR